MTWVLQMWPVPRLDHGNEVDGEDADDDNDDGCPQVHLHVQDHPSSCASQ